MENVQVKTILIGASPSLTKALADVLPSASTREYPYNMNVLTELPEDMRPACVICTTPPEGIPSIEIAQLFRSLYVDAVVLYVTEERKDFDRKIFKKNGFSDAFLLPVDQDEFAKTVKRALANAGEIKVFRPVKLIDLSADTVLEFKTFVHLPKNDKYVCYSNAGRPLPKDRLDRLKAKEVGAMLVSEADMPKFYTYTAECLRKLGSNEKIGATEKRERLESAVRDLIGGLFNDSTQGNHISKGREMVDDCQKIVRAFIVDGSKKNEWFDKVMALGSQETGTYSHLSNVATFCSLFSMGLGIGDPEEMAMAGLLHDVGMVNVPRETQMKKLSELTPDEMAAHKRHPQASIEIVKNWRMNIPDRVVTAILQHHERSDGSGYPEGLNSQDISKEAQVLAIADEFDMLITGTHGEKLAPAAAMYEIIETNLANPVNSKFDPEILRALKKLMPVAKAG